MTKKFSPMLIGKYTDRIEFQTASWKNCIFQLNHLFANWNVYFDEKLDLVELAVIMNMPDLKFYIKEKHVRKNPKHEDFIKSMSVKIDKFFDMVDFPSFEHLIEAVAKVKASIYPDPRAELNKLKQVNAGSKPVPEVGEFSFDQWKSKIFDGLNFSFIPELEAEITEQHSVWTKNERENAVYLYMVRLSETLNVLNDCGLSLSVQDYPKFVFSQLEPFSTTKYHSDLQFPSRGEKKYPICHFRPKLSILDPDSPILQFMKNLSDSEIDELINKYS